MSAFKIVVADRTGKELGEISTFQGLQWSEVLNREGDASFKVNLFDPNASLLAIGNRDIYIYEDDEVRFGGRYFIDDGEYNGKKSEVTIHLKGFFYLLSKRRTAADIDYSDPDSGGGKILRDLVNYTQALPYGNLGITIGTIENMSLARERTAYEYKNIYDAFIEMTEVQNGIDFEITQTKVLNTYAYKGTDKSASVIFEHRQNFDSFRFRREADLVNEAIVLGSGMGDEVKQVQVVVDNSLKEAYGLYQETVSYIDVEDQQLAIDKGTFEIKDRGLPVVEYEIVQKPGSRPYYEDLEIGDIVTVRVNSPFIQENRKLRIYSRKVDVSAGDRKIITYSFVKP